MSIVPECSSDAMCNECLTLGVVILNYNDSDTTLQLLAQISAYEEIAKIVIVDNRSTNDSFSTLRNYESSKVRVIQAEKNGGYSYGNNIGIRYLRNNFPVDVVCIANPDVSFTAITISAIKKAFLETDYCIVAPVMCEADGRISNDSYWTIPSYWENFAKCFSLYRRISFRKKHVVDYSKKYMPVEVLPGSFFAFRNKCFEEIGDFNEDTFLYGEEITIAYKAREFGQRECLLTNETFLHMHAVTTKKYLSLLKKHQLLLEAWYVFGSNVRKVGVCKKWIFRIAMRISVAEFRFISFVRRSKTHF